MEGNENVDPKTVIEFSKIMGLPTKDLIFYLDHQNDPELPDDIKSEYREEWDNVVSDFEACREFMRPIILRASENH